MTSRSTSPHRPLDRRSLPRETVALAQALIGCTLVRLDRAGVRAGRIVETEAYPPNDPASHAFRGRTKRNAAMFLDPFHAYVYQIYGTSFCLNVTSEEAECGAAVLLRALEPLEGLDAMATARGTARVRDLARGPGRLCRALDVGPAFDGVDLLRAGPLFLAAGAPPQAVGCSVRIGISKAAEAPLRFYEQGSPFLSGLRSHSP